MHLRSTAAALGAALLALPASLLAHAGHGAPGASHWHATDLFGPVLIAGAGVLVWWLSRGGK